MESRFVLESQKEVKKAKRTKKQRLWAFLPFLPFLPSFFSYFIVAISAQLPMLILATLDTRPSTVTTTSTSPRPRNASVSGQDQAAGALTAFARSEGGGFAPGCGHRKALGDESRAPLASGAGAVSGMRFPAGGPSRMTRCCLAAAFGVSVGRERAGGGTA